MEPDNIDATALAVVVEADLGLGEPASIPKKRHQPGLQGRVPSIRERPLAVHAQV